MSGTLLPQWGVQLPALTWLDLYDNRLQGSLPEAWSAWELQHLSLRKNRLTGRLPRSWGERWGSVRNLDLSLNSLTGGGWPNGCYLFTCCICAR